MTPSSEVKKAATLTERERIIKLLENKGSHEWNDGHDEITCNTCWNIALIKGENK
jgi:hypothetical protein